VFVLQYFIILPLTVMCYGSFTARTISTKSTSADGQYHSVYVRFMSA